MDVGLKENETRALTNPVLQTPAPHPADAVDPANHEGARHRSDERGDDNISSGGRERILRFILAFVIDGYHPKVDTSFRACRYI